MITQMKGVGSMRADKKETRIATISSRKRRKAFVLLSFALPGLLYYAIFHYVPMIGLTIAFKDYNPFKGIWASSWVGMKWFVEFYESIYFLRLIRNTFTLSALMLIFAFPLPIFFALMMYEVRGKKFRSAVQSISYLPHFISMVIVCGLVRTFTSESNGLLNVIIVALGGESIPFMSSPQWFRPIYVISGIWQSTGWSSIIYFANVNAIDTSLFEAADIDGASRLQKIVNISLPSLKPTIITLLLMQLGNIMNVGYEKVLLLYETSTYEVADVISTYVYRAGLVSQRYSFAAAVGLFNSIVGVVLISVVNSIARKANESSLW
jgi:putative aldouronate transport system permease protein